jgi:hypothetical protein
VHPSHPADLCGAAVVLFGVKLLEISLLAIIKNIL